MLTALLLAAQAPAPQIDCARAQSQYDLTMCESERFDAADQELNRQWRLALQRARDNDRAAGADGREKAEAALRSAQRAWLTLRDNHCTVESYNARGGSAQPMFYEGCRANLTAARAEQLKELLAER